MIITLSLNPSIDYVLQVPQIHMEDTLRAKQARFEPGGKGINVSRVLTRFGIENCAWGFCGGDTGNWLRRFLEAEHVAQDFVQTAESTRINVIVTEAETHQQLRVSASGEAIGENEAQQMREKFNTVSKGDVQWVSLGGSIPPGLHPGYVRELIEQCNDRGIGCLLDADGKVLEEGLKGHPYLIKPNQFELERLVGRPLQSTAEVIEASRSLIRDGLVEIVVTSLAEAGALLVSQDRVIHAKAPQVPVSSKVGAGDSMVAGLIKGLLEGLPLASVLQAGIAAGSAAVMTGGTELCYIEDFTMLLPQVTVEVLS